jgi:rhodanese-related sulfurtransferase
MKRLLLWLAVPLIRTAAGVTLIASGCNIITGGTVAPAVIKDVTPAQANDLIQKNSGSKKFAVLDVRTPQEYGAGHLAGALNVDLGASNFKDEVNKLDKNRTYLVYCSTGFRSAAASKIMADLGFKDIYNMTGGITDWQAKGYPVVK